MGVCCSSYLLVCVCVLLTRFMEDVYTNEPFSWPWQALAEIRSAYCGFVSCACCGCDSVSPLGVISGATAKESSLYSHPAEPAPALNKDTAAHRSLQHMAAVNTRLTDMIHLHCPNVKKYSCSYTNIKCPRSQGDRQHSR